MEETRRSLELALARVRADRKTSTNATRRAALDQAIQALAERLQSILAPNV